VSSQGGPARLTAAVLVGVAVFAIAFGAAAQSRNAERPGSTYAALAQLPDWSGWWAFSGTNAFDDFVRMPPPFKPGALEAARARAATGPDPLRYCRPWTFAGLSGNFTEALEVLFTPNRVTLTNERGLLRRIYTDGQPPPADPDLTNTGLSLGHWEGQTLVVETASINPRAPYANGVALGRDAAITERISLEDPSTLKFEVVTVAPEIMTAPDRRTWRYKRMAKTRGNEISFCSDNDRSIEPGTGKQRFDLTPPTDLPPPPR
jgi:hypothetical protein